MHVRRLHSIALGLILLGWCGACASSGGQPKPGPPGDGSCICEEGKAQSPIDLDPAVAAALPQLVLPYGTTFATIERIKPDFKVRLNPAPTLTISGEVFDFVEFHFHQPNEHHLAGVKTGMEIHFVHRNKVGELAVVGVFLVPSTFNRTVQDVFDHLGSPDPWRFDPKPLLPPQDTYLRYAGSLTTGTCAEGVRWHVFQQPIPIAQSQIDDYERRFGDTARKVKERNGRVVLRSGG